MLPILMPIVSPNSVFIIEEILSGNMSIFRDLEAATGIDMSGKAKKKQKKKDRYAPTEGQAVRQRLEVRVKE